MAWFRLALATSSDTRVSREELSLERRGITKFSDLFRGLRYPSAVPFRCRGFTNREEDRDKVLFFSPPLFVPLVLFPKLFNEDFFISCFLGVLIGLK